MIKSSSQKKIFFLILILMLSSLQIVFLPLIRPITKYIIFKPLPLDKIYSNKQIQDTCKKSL